MAKRKKILILGSGGFIFSNFIRQSFYDKLPYIISSIDRVRESHIIHNIYVNTNHSFHIADIRDSHILHVIFEKERPDIVIHGADESNHTNIDDIVSTNILGTQNVINECVKAGSKLIYLSTNRVYGDLCDEQMSPYIETDQINPENTFAATKAASELLIKATKELNYNILRLSDSYGPWQTVNNLIPNIINSIFKETKIEIYGSGYQTRDWTHVLDVYSALVTIIENGKDKEIYNVTSKQEFSNIEVAQLICNVFGKGYELINHVEKDVIKRYAMNNDKIKELGWVPQLKLRDGLTQVCQWYLNNKYVIQM
jgi:dTDP-glucose 4,6-dehydratase